MAVEIKKSTDGTVVGIAINGTALVQRDPKEGAAWFYVTKARLRKIRLDEIPPKVTFEIQVPNRRLDSQLVVMIVGTVSNTKAHVAGSIWKSPYHWKEPCSYSNYVYATQVLTKKNNQQIEFQSLDFVDHDDVFLDVNFWCPGNTFDDVFTFAEDYGRKLLKEVDEVLSSLEGRIDVAVRSIIDQAVK